MGKRQCDVGNAEQGIWACSEDLNFWARASQTAQVSGGAHIRLHEKPELGASRLSKPVALLQDDPVWPATLRGQNVQVFK